MGIEVYGTHPKKKNHRKKHIVIFVVASFSLILFLLIYTSFYGDIPITGNVVVGNIINFNKDVIDSNKTSNNEEIKGIEFEAKLTIPDLEINGKFEEVEITGSSDAYLQVGNQEFYLGDIRKNYLIFEDYDGKISFDSRNVLEFKGKSSGVSVNGVLITAQSKATTKVNIDNPLKYEEIKIGEGTSIKELSYQTSGTIKLNDGKNVFSINNEEITLNNFHGTILIKNKEFILEGYIEQLDVIGDSNIQIKS